MISPARIPALAALTAVLAPPSQAAPLPSPDGRIRTAADALPGRYIVALKETKASAASVRDEAARTRIARAHGADIRHTYGTALHGHAAGSTAEQARRTAACPAVAYGEQDAEHHGSATRKDPPSRGLDRIDQRSLPLDRRHAYDTEATGVTVYLVESGLRTAHAAEPAVVDMSINGGASRSEDEAIEKSIASGVTWVASCGNDSEDACGNSPGGITDALDVNNADSTGTRLRAGSGLAGGRCGFGYGVVGGVRAQGPGR
ncbi:protease inhibitor I9 family protein [Streptomyces qinglanensis]|uniref:protease inhibitor I9 family protein n=1 Tax=Streptomyces qinglanensis TaxID=943816 RepID=UPI003D74C824